MTTLSSITPVQTLRLTSAEFILVQAYSGKRYSRVGAWRQEFSGKEVADERVWSILLKVVDTDKSEKKVLFKIHFCLDSSVVQHYGSVDYRDH